MSDENIFDVAIIGAGFYGTSIALKLSQQHKNVILIEKEPDILMRASLWNQARVHNGYHYPRSFSTAYRSRINYRKFLEKFDDCVENVNKIYGVSKVNSKINALQFETLCGRIGASLKEPPESTKQLFDFNYVERVYIAQEQVFNADKLRIKLKKKIGSSSVKLMLNTTAKDIKSYKKNFLIQLSNNEVDTIFAKKIFNCTYSGLNGFTQKYFNSHLKHEFTEMTLIEMPEHIKDIGVTIMDGPFFSVMPFPPRGLHTFSHVRYTPHATLQDSNDIYKLFDRFPKKTSFKKMLLDSIKFMPALEDAKYHDSIFEVKTVLKKNEQNDGRPILFEKSIENSNFISILGGKIDNIFDIEEKIDLNE